MKYLLVALVVAVVLWLLWGRSSRRGERGAGARPPRVGARMTACAHCGLHVPEQEALFDAGGRAYCGEEHRRLGAR